MNFWLLPSWFSRFDTDRPIPADKHISLAIMDYEIKPKMIDTSKRFVSSFGKHERECAAWWLVKFAQDRGSSWEPIELSDIENYIDRNMIEGDSCVYWERPVYNKGVLTWERGSWISNGCFLISWGEQLKENIWIIRVGDKLHFTKEFVDRCYKSPKKSMDYYL